MLPPHLTILLEGARAKYGRRADRFVGYLFQGDHLMDDLLEVFAQRRKQDIQCGRADDAMFEKALEEGHAAVPEAPQELHDFFRQVEEVPLWVDAKLLELGGKTYLRCGLMPALVIGLGCLPLAYLSAVGNKPLAFTKELTIPTQAPRRLNTTGKFFLDVCTPGWLQPFGPAWKKALRVRRMHAQKRRNMRQLKKTPWRVADWGHPINQLYSAGTGLLFSAMSLLYLRRIGFHFSARESEAVMHLWRYVGYLLGIDVDLLSATETEGQNLVEMFLDLSGPPDKDSQELVQALMDHALPSMMEKMMPFLNPAAPSRGWIRGAFARMARWCAGLIGLGTQEGRARFCYGLSQGLIGHRALGLQYKQSFWRCTAPAMMWTMIATLELCRRCVPGGTRLATYLGFAACKRVITEE